jgi:hypothetical protein
MTKVPGSLLLTYARAAGFVVLTLSLTDGAASAWAASPRNGDLHVSKECSQDKGAPGDFCTITSSNLAEITVGSKVYYDQAAGIPKGVLDSNVVLDAGMGNRALGRCTLDLGTHLGLCTFSDGTGQFAGFHARVNVDCTSGCIWNGSYSFTEVVTITVTGPGAATSIANMFQTVSSLISLDASRSTSLNAGALTYSWTVSPGFPSAAMTGGNTATPSLQLLSQGIYQFNVTVTDTTGAASTATVTVLYI